MSKFLTALVFLACILIAGGFVALAVWDIPVTQKPVEKVLQPGTAQQAPQTKNKVLESPVERFGDSQDKTKPN